MEDHGNPVVGTSVASDPVFPVFSVKDMQHVESRRLDARKNTSCSGRYIRWTLVLARKPRGLNSVGKRRTQHSHQGDK